LSLGTKIRTLRRQQRLTQAALGRHVGVSHSYINLIEHGRRAVNVELLVKLAEVLPLDLKNLSTLNEDRTVSELLEVFGDPMFEDLGVVAPDVTELGATYPQAAQAFTRLYGAFCAARKATRSLGEAVSQGVALQKIHSRFPSEEVSDLIQEHKNYFPELEHGADVLYRAASLRVDSLFDGLVSHVRRIAGVEVRIEARERMQSALRSYDPARKVLSISEGLRRGRRNFAVAYQIGLLTQGPIMDHIASNPILTSEESRASCRVALANYFAAAVLMPYDDFVVVARRERYDIESLADTYDTSFEQVCHRLTTLRRPGTEGIPFYMIRVDVAGNVSKRFEASGLQIPRFSGSCPRWNTFAAFFTPGVIHTQISQMPDGKVFFCVARTVRKEGGGYAAPRPQYAIGIGCDVSRASEIVYADGLNLSSREGVVPVGPSCRLCERVDCDQRAYPPLHHAFPVDENRRGVSFYAPPPPLK